MKIKQPEKLIYPTPTIQSLNYPTFINEIATLHHKQDNR